MPMSFRWIMSPQSWNTMKHPLQLFYEYSNTFNNYCNSNLSKISYLSLNLVIFMGIFQCKCRFSQQVLTKSYQILNFFPLKNSNAIKVSSHKYFVKLQIFSIINLNRFKIPYFLKKYPFFAESSKLYVDLVNNCWPNVDQIFFPCQKLDQVSPSQIFCLYLKNWRN